jgi:hypothetical protein
MNVGSSDTHNLAIAAKKSADVGLKLAEGNQAAWLIRSAQDLDRNFLRFGVQNTGGAAAENVAVSVLKKLVCTSDGTVLWTKPFTFQTVKYLPPKENTNGPSQNIGGWTSISSLKTKKAWF